MGQPSHLEMTRQSGSYGENDDIVPVLLCFMFAAQYIQCVVCFGFLSSYVTRFSRLVQNIAHIWGSAVTAHVCVGFSVGVLLIALHVSLFIHFPHPSGMTNWLCRLLEGENRIASGDRNRGAHYHYGAYCEGGSTFVGLCSFTPSEVGAEHL